MKVGNNMIKEVIRVYEELSSTEGHVNPIVNLTPEHYEYINYKPLYIHFYNNNYNSIKLESSDNDYIITIYYDGFVYQMYTVDVYKIYTHKQLNNVINNIISEEDIYTDDINAYRISKCF